MRLIFDELAWDDYLFWQKHEPKILSRINELIKEIRRTTFSGLGKPEPLKGDFSGWWSRRITGEHRMVYRISGKGEGQTLELAQLRYHY